MGHLPVAEVVFNTFNKLMLFISNDIDPMSHSNSAKACRWEKFMFLNIWLT